MTQPTSDKTRDYRYRLSINRKDWIKLAGKLAEEVTYSNFKDSVHQRADQQDKHSRYMQIWWIMKGCQTDEEQFESDRPVKRKARKR